jgi:hypothetical protein
MDKTGEEEHTSNRPDGRRSWDSEGWTTRQSPGKHKMEMIMSAGRLTTSLSIMVKGEMDWPVLL